MVVLTAMQAGPCHRVGNYDQRVISATYAMISCALDILMQVDLLIPVLPQLPQLAAERAKVGQLDSLPICRDKQDHNNRDDGNDAELAAASASAQRGSALFLAKAGERAHRKVGPAVFDIAQEQGSTLWKQERMGA